MGPGDLAQALSGLPLISHPNLIMGIERSEDAGIYKLSDDFALIQTVDFFTPIVDDPYAFGQIAAANALSDVYAKGGRPLTAMNIVCFPIGKLDISVLQQILAGGLDKLHESGAILLGGHSVDDPELKFGMSVTGTIHPDKVVFNGTAKAGDKVILTKPLGTGIISTALKNGKAGKRIAAAAVKSMSTLNAKASELMQAVGIDAGTDVTGFGLLGHASEMVEKTGIGMVIQASAVPLLPGTLELAEAGFLPGGLKRNRDFRKHMVKIEADVPAHLADILFDPQTSGGLLIAVPEKKASKLLAKMHRGGVPAAAIIGEIVARPKGQIKVTP